MIRVGFAIVTTLLLSGCFPERQTRVPDIIGTVIRDGAPAAQVRLALSLSKDECKVPVETVQSDNNGAFRFKAIKDWGAGKVFVSPEQTYSICLDAGDGFELAFSQRTWRGPAPESFLCDLNAMKCGKK